MSHKINNISFEGEKSEHSFGMGKKHSVDVSLSVTLFEHSRCGTPHICEEQLTCRDHLT